MKPAAPLSDPLVPPDLRGWFDRVAGVVRRSLVPLLLIQLGVALVSAIVTFMFSATVLADPAKVTAQGSPAGLLLLVGLLVTLAVGIFAQGASIYVAIRDAAGDQATVAEALRFAGARSPALIGWGLAAGVLTFFGLMMLVVPGAYFAVVFGATLAGVITVERGGFARCFELVNSRLWPTVGRMAIFGVAGLAYEVVAGFIGGALSEPGSVNGAVIQALCSVPLGMVTVGVATVTYAELRFHENGVVFTDTLAASLRR